MFSELVVAYLFLGGTGAGALLIAAVLMLLADERAVSRGVVVRFRDNGSAAYRRLFVPILVASLVVLVLGALCLAADVGRLDRILLLAVSSPSNYLVVGFWALLLCGTLAAAMLLVWLGVPSVSLPLFRALAVLLAAVSFVAVIYTGLLQNSSLKKYAQNPEPLQGQKAQKGFRASAFALFFVQVAIAFLSCNSSFWRSRRPGAHQLLPPIDKALCLCYFYNRK